MEWNDGMRDLKTIDQVHVRTGDGWRRWDGMIRWMICWPSSRTCWWPMKRMGWDDLISDPSLKTIDQVHVHPGDGWRGWDGMIMWEVFNQMTNLTYNLETDEQYGMRALHSTNSYSWRTIYQAHYQAYSILSTSLSTFLVTARLTSRLPSLAACQWPIPESMPMDDHPRARNTLVIEKPPGLWKLWMLQQTSNANG